MQSQFYRRCLPHWQIPQATFFITYRLFGSIPLAEIKRIEEAYFITNPQKTIDLKSKKVLSPQEYRKNLYAAHKLRFLALDKWLDRAPNGPYWLSDPKIAEMNASAFKYYDGKRYELHAYCIMPNHVHLLFSLLPGAPVLWKVLQDLKKYTGRHSNQVLKLSGIFWERESYDHIVRQHEFDRILVYILNNPVKAGLVKNWAEWKWTYCAPFLREDMCPETPVSGRWNE